MVSVDGPTPKDASVVEDEEAAIGAEGAGGDGEMRLRVEGRVLMDMGSMGALRRLASDGAMVVGVKVENGEGETNHESNARGDHTRLSPCPAVRPLLFSACMTSSSTPLSPLDLLGRPLSFMTCAHLVLIVLFR